MNYIGNKEKLRRSNQKIVYLKKGLEKKDKIIDLMAEQLVKAHEWFYSEFDNYTKEDFVKYFNQKIEKGE